MTKKTFSELQTEVANWLGYDLGQDSRLDTYVQRWINEGQRHLLMQSWWPWTVQVTSLDTTAGVPVYTLVPQARAIKKTTTRLDKDGRLIPTWFIPRSKADEFLPNAENLTAVPNRCWMEGMDASGAWRMQLYPTPDATYTFHYGYYERVAALSASGDTLAGPEEADEVVRDYALWKGFSHTKSEIDDEATQAFQIFLEGKANLELFLKPDNDAEHFAAPFDLRDFTDTAYVDLNTSDPLDLRGW